MRRKAEPEEHDSSYEFARSSNEVIFDIISLCQLVVFIFEGFLNSGLASRVSMTGFGFVTGGHFWRRWE
jgi:hypothetical protein